MRMFNPGESGRSVLMSAARALLALGGCVLLLYFMDVGCLVRFFFGISCPGCGLTRAWLAFLRGDVATAIAYHPLFWLVPVVVAPAFLLGHLDPQARRARRVCNAIMLVGACALVALWAWRMAMPLDTGLLFGGRIPAGVVERDVVHVQQPGWLRLLGQLVAYARQLGGGF